MENTEFIISRTSRKDTIPEIVHNSKIINNANEIANKFNSFFANVGPNLAKKDTTGNL